MERIAIFPGSFDPFTIGHESIVRRGLILFDKIIVAVGYNATKPGFLPLQNRLDLISNVFVNIEKVEVDYYEELTVEFARRKHARFILRGLRTAADFEYERAIAQVNKSMSPEIESVFILTTPEYTPVNSTIVRDIIRHGGDATKFLPQNIDYKKFIPGND